MSAHHAASSCSICDWRGRLIRLVLRIAATVAVGFIGGTVGYLEFRVRVLALHSPMADAGLLIYRHVCGYGEFCAAGGYAACFGLLTRRSSGRFVAALLSGLAEKRQKHLGPSRFSLATMLLIVVGFALLFAGMRLRGDYLRRRFEDRDSRGVQRVSHATSQSLSARA